MEINWKLINLSIKYDKFLPWFKKNGKFHFLFIIFAVFMYLLSEMYTTLRYVKLSQTRYTINVISPQVQGRVSAGKNSNTCRNG